MLAMNEYVIYQRCILNVLLQYRVDLAFDDWGAKHLIRNEFIDSKI